MHRDPPNKKFRGNGFVADDFSTNINVKTLIKKGQPCYKDAPFFFVLYNLSYFPTLFIIPRIL